MKPDKQVSLFRGHPIRLSQDIYIFCDTRKPTSKTWKDRGCGHCGKPNTPQGHDGCLGTLPGVMNACCGHGVIAAAYVQFSENIILSGRRALDWISQNQDEK